MVFKEDITEQVLIQEQIEGQRPASVADEEEMRNDEEEQPLDQVLYHYYNNVFVFAHYGVIR